ncbi:GNAT family N-acetyltransferase [Zobellella iuensis]|uniref:GNAT family N-acetyltransferase n=1 Tax=Zobellella iuensis TaxID=2803811 RepID=A0ABS1QPQ7_9GAMM|nr:GNAT family N-acetyltransferase [Zobellella iuensis]MBL1376840.1 GNAT family N-acetyltransferase [Zobellella iuensis]
MHWQLAAFNELSTTQLYRMLALRSDIFVVEQGCAYQDLDGRDLAPGTLHLNAWQGERLLATARLLGPGVHTPEHVWIGRVAVAAQARGQGLARQLMRRAMAAAAGRWPGYPLRLGAQTYVRDFYLSLGFAPLGPEYLEDGIPHQQMEFRCKA